MNFKSNFKTICVFLVFILMTRICLHGQSGFTMKQPVSKTMILNVKSSSNKVISPFKDVGAIYGMAISGNIELTQPYGYARIILTDDYGFEYLIYEANRFLLNGSSGSFSAHSEETCELDNVTPKTLRVELDGANITLNEMQLAENYVEPKSKAQNSRATRQVDEKVAQVNAYLESSGATWRAGATSVAKMTYEEKKVLFGGSVPNLQGFEYYAGGVFVLETEDGANAGTAASTRPSDSGSLYVKEFDWRNRHGKNWITPVKNQKSCGSCWAFAATGTVEQLVNLYYNQQINMDLSEQQILSCSGGGSCTGGLPSYALDYIISDGIVNEECFPYTATDEDCSNKCSDPGELVKIGKRTPWDKNGTVDDLKARIISGPVSGGVSPWLHALNLIGYKTIQAGDRIYIKQSDQSEWVTVKEGNELIGKTAWIFKNSWGTYWGDNGFGYVVTDISNIGWTHSIFGPVSSKNFTDSDIVCADYDGDGYYNWGIGSKPAHCPPCPDKADGDDSNPYLGTLDAYGFPEILTTTKLNLEAEFQSWSNALVKKKWSGYSGSGYLNSGNTKGEWIEFTAQALSDAEYSCKITYANGSSDDRNLNVLLNGTKVSSEACAGTNGWGTWADLPVSVKLSLVKGENKIRLVATTDNGLANIDKIELQVIDGNNQSPFVENPISDEAIGMKGSTTWKVDLNTVFSDLETPNSLKYSVSVANTSNATGTVDGSILTISSVSLGKSDVTVTATDPDGASVTEKFAVKVVPERFRNLVLLVQFPDISAAFSQNQVYNLMNEKGYSEFGNNGSVHDYYWESTNNNVYFSSYVSTIYTASNERDYYDKADDYDKLHLLIHEMLNNLENNGFDFSNLTIDENDGYAAGVNVIYAGTAEGTRKMWPAAGGLGQGHFFADGVEIGYFAISQMEETELVLNTFCHESGHTLMDLPDYYDTYHDDGHAHGVGRYCLMGSSQSPKNPFPFNPLIRIQKGWEKPTDISVDASDQQFSIKANSFNTLRYNNPNNQGEYFLIESIRNSGRWADAGNDGLLIWHVDENAYDHIENKPNKYQAMTPEKHYTLSVEQADGLFQLETAHDSGGNVGDPGDVFSPGTIFTNTSTPSTKWWNGSESGLDITNIALNGEYTDFTVKGQSIKEQLFYEMEEGIVMNGSMDKEHSGYTGTGYANTDNGAGNYVEINVTIATAGNFDLTLRYANGAGARPMNVSVNGTLVGTLAGNATDSWTKWQTETLANIALGAGSSTIRFTGTTYGSTPNLDNIKLTRVQQTNTPPVASNPISYIPKTVSGDPISIELNNVLDTDGEGVDYSDDYSMKSVKKDGKPDELDITVVPNPATDWISVDFTLMNDEHIYVYVINSTGSIVSVLADKKVSSGQNSVNFDVSTLVPGIYSIVLKNESTITIERFVVK